jgi:Threonyl and Alanyl tRNA synthetase second additional domain
LPCTHFFRSFCSSLFIYFQSIIIDATVESEVNKIIKSKQKFERLVITKEEGLALFADNPFKTTILQTKVPDGTRTTVYRCGDLIDLCRGPHLPHTGKVKAFAATRHSAAHWLGQADHDSLQRLYGISFPDKKMLKVWQENQEKVRDLFSYFPPFWVYMTTTTMNFLEMKEKEKQFLYDTGYDDKGRISFSEQE